MPVSGADGEVDVKLQMLNGYNVTVEKSERRVAVVTL